MKKIKFQSRLRAKVGRQGPPGAARPQPYLLQLSAVLDSHWPFLVFRALRKGAFSVPTTSVLGTIFGLQKPFHGFYLFFLPLKDFVRF